MISSELKKSKIIIDTDALLKYFNLLIDSKHHKLSKDEKNQLIQLIEFFKGRELYIIPQVLAEIYASLKRKANDSKSKIKNWLEIIEKPHLNRILEIYIPKEEILEEIKYLDLGFTNIALMKALDKNSLLITTNFDLIRSCKSIGLEAHHIEEIFII